MTDADKLVLLAEHADLKERADRATREALMLTNQATAKTNEAAALMTRATAVAKQLGITC